MAYVPNLYNTLVSGLVRTCASHTKDSTLQISCSVDVWLDAIRARATELHESGTCDTLGKVLTAIDDEEQERSIEKAVAAKVASGEVDGTVGMEKGLAENLANLQLGDGAPALPSNESCGWTEELDRAWRQMRRDNVPGWRTQGPAQHRARQRLLGNTMAQQLHRALRNDTMERDNQRIQEALDRMRQEMDEAQNRNAA